jgi:asparagine synthase (glutamine-hydrolysing)
VCGIAGLFDPGRVTGPEALDRQVVAMTATLAHRGPDAAGSWSDPDHGVALGYRRLAVVGLGPEGAAGGW